jgi:hypothetical protein
MGQLLPVALSAVALENAVMVGTDPDIKWLLRLVNCVHGVIFISRKEKKLLPDEDNMHRSARKDFSKRS